MLRDGGIGIAVPFGTNASVIICPFKIFSPPMLLLTSWGLPVGLGQTLATRYALPGALLVLGHDWPLRYVGPPTGAAVVVVAAVLVVDDEDVDEDEDDEAPAVTALVLVLLVELVVDFVVELVLDGVEEDVLDGVEVDVGVEVVLELVEVDGVVTGPGRVRLVAVSAKPRP